MEGLRERTTDNPVHEDARGYIGVYGVPGKLAGPKDCDTFQSSNSMAVLHEILTMKHLAIECLLAGEGRQLRL